MRSRVAGSVLLRHLGPRVFGAAATPTAAPRPLLAGDGGERGVWARLLATSAAETAKEEAAASKDNVGSTAAATAEAIQAAKEGEKSGVVSSYWGIAPSKLVNKDGAEWKWSCFRVTVGGLHVGHIDRSHEAPPAQGAARQDRVLDRQIAARAHGYLLPEEVRVPCDDAGNGGSGAGDGGRDAAPPAVAPSLRAERRVDPGAAGGGGERADAPDDLHGGGGPQVVRARAGAGRAGRLLQRLLRRVPPLPQVRAPRRRLPRGGGHPLLHRVPARPGGRQDRERPGPAHRHRLLAPPRRRQAQGRRHRRARRRGAPPRREPLRRGHPFPGVGAQQDACAARISLTGSWPAEICLCHCVWYSGR